jgi:flagellar basal-body rod protein FlgC
MADSSTTWEICGSGLRAQWRRMRVIAENLSNAENTRTADGRPYRKRYVVFSTLLDEMRGVSVEGTAESQEPGRKVFEPGHPHADADGMVNMPNVQMPVETVDMMSASRAYRATFMAMQNFRKICRKTIELMG